MLVSKNWLANHLDLTGLSNPEFDDILTFAGVEVEGLSEQGVSTDLVVVARIVQTEQHPNADRLSVTQVDAGEGELRQIVCGAKNYKVGDKVPCALPGAELPGGFTIGETVMRKVESRGMLCSAVELGLGTDHSGLMILPPEWETGKPLRHFVENDTIFEIEITPNRPDLNGVIGLAREIAALTSNPLKRPEISLNASDEKAGDLVAVAGAGRWFDYYYWLEERDAPDFARTVDIHRKPGYDPCELFLTSRFRAMRKVFRKKLGFRSLVDVIPLDATLVRGSHGLGTEPAICIAKTPVSDMKEIRGLVESLL
mgnify:CR=1 FL=1